MSSPSTLGDAGYPVTAVIPLSTATGAYYFKTSGTSTGTKLTTSRQIDLARALHVGTTGGKPLDSTVHPRAAAAPRYKSLKVSLPLEINFLTSGLNLFVTVDHKFRSSTAGAGSTWASRKSETRRFKMGTDTNAVFHNGFASAVNLQAAPRYYKANITFATRKASSTAAKDTTTATKLLCFNPVIELSGADAPQVSVPAVIS
jgi:hypothetical protein